jgi:hypothetical protein
MEGYEAEYKRLNKEQRRAVDSTEGPLLVMAVIPAGPRCAAIIWRKLHLHGRLSYALREAATINS